MIKYKTDIYLKMKKSTQHEDSKYTIADSKTCTSKNNEANRFWFREHLLGY